MAIANLQSQQKSPCPHATAWRKRLMLSQVDSWRGKPLNSTWDHTLTISRINVFWTTRNESLEPNRRENVFASIDTFSPRLRWRHHRPILTRPPNELARVKSGSGSHSYQGNRNPLSAIRLIQNPEGTKKHSSSQELPLGRSHLCFPAGGPTRC